MQGCDVDVGDIHRHLGDAIFVDIPADGLGTFQSAGNHNGVTLSVFHRFADNRIPFSTWAAFLAYVEGDGVGAAGGGSVEIEVDGD